MESARERYLAAVSRTREADTELPGDRGTAREQARLAEREALAQYLVVLQIFKDLVLKGKIPPEESEAEGPGFTSLLSQSFAGSGILKPPAPCRASAPFAQAYQEVRVETEGTKCTKLVKQALSTTS